MRKIFGLQLVVCLTFVGSVWAADVGCTAAVPTNHKQASTVNIVRMWDENYTACLAEVWPKVAIATAETEVKRYVRGAAVVPLEVDENLPHAHILLIHMKLEDWTKYFGARFEYKKSTKTWYMTQGPSIPKSLAKIIRQFPPLNSSK